MNRRSMLRLIGISPAMAPLAAKAASNAAIADLSGITASGLHHGIHDPPKSLGDPTGAEARRVLQIPRMRAEVISALFEEERRIGFIDPDIASKKSFSMAAKIAFQRQRNVEIRLERMTSDNSWWGRANRIVSDYLNTGLFK